MTRRTAEPSTLKNSETHNVENHTGGTVPGEVRHCLLRTLVNNKPVCAIIPSDHELSMKKLAAAFGGKRAKMMQPSDAERITGYEVGGISPFGQLRISPTVIEVQALAHEQIYINGGQRGLLVRLDPNDAVRVLFAISAALIA